ncbi:MAG: hypothetical protein ABIL09_18560, partial [Gemmatimonadota bacterium]
MPRYLTALLVLLLLVLALRAVPLLPSVQRACQRQLEQRLAGATGGRVAIDGVHTNLWDALEVQGLRLDLPSGPLARVEVDRARVRFSLWGLLAGGRPLGEVAMDRLSLRRRGSDAGALPAAGPTPLSRRALARWAPASARLATLAVGAEADSGEVLVEVAGALSLEEQGPAGAADRTFELRADGVRVSGPAGPGPAWDGRGRLRLGGDRLELAELSATTGSSVLTASARLDTAVTGAVRLDLDLPELWGAVFGLAPGQASPLAGAAEIRLALRGPPEAPEVRAHLDLRGARLRDVPLREARAALVYAGGAVRLDSLEVGVGQGRLRAHGWLDRPSSPGRGQLLLTLDDADAATLEALLTGRPGACDGVVSGRLQVDVGPAGPDSSRVEVWGRQMAFHSVPLGEWHLAGRLQGTQLDAALSSDVVQVSARGTVGGLGEHELTWQVALADEARLRRVTGLQVGGRGTLTATSSGALGRPSVRVRGQLWQPRLAFLGLDALHVAADLDSTGALRVDLRDGSGQVRFELRCDLRQGRIAEGRLVLAGAALSELLRTADASQWQGRAFVDLDFRGTPADPQVGGVVLLSGLGYSHQRFGEAVGQVTLQEGVAQLHVAAQDSSLRLGATLRLGQGLPFSAAGTFTDVDLTPFLSLAAAE